MRVDKVQRKWLRSSFSLRRHNPWLQHGCGESHCRAIGRKTRSVLGGLQMQNLCLKGVVRRRVRCSE